MVTVLAICVVLALIGLYLFMAGGAELNEREDRARAEAEQHWTN